MGAFLGTLGTSGTIVGLIAGFGELMGYGLRSVAGYIGDKTHKYWIITIFGYCINMIAVPALALAGSWPLAAALMILERIGRALRRPNVEAMLSYVVTGACVAAGFVDFSLIAFQFQKTSTGFGVYDTGFGIAWFLGNATMGFLYDKSIITLIIFSIALQILSINYIYLCE